MEKSRNIRITNIADTNLLAKIQKKIEESKLNMCYFNDENNTFIIVFYSFSYLFNTIPTVF